MVEQGDLFGAPINWDPRRGRAVTSKNKGTSFTPEQRRAELTRWWEEHMQEVFPQFASDMVTAIGAAIASRSGRNVVDIGPEMDALESLSAVKDALAASRGLAITAEELVDKVTKESRELEESSGIAHLGPKLASVVVVAYADVRALSPQKRTELLNRVHQRRLPQF